MSYEYDPHVIRSEVYPNPEAAILSAGNEPFAEGPHSAPNHDDYTATARVRKVKPEHCLGYLSTAALTFNRTIGTAIFVTPSTILGINGSKTICIILWFVGGALTWAGMTVYLEYGIRWPLNGGELHYIDRVWKYPRKLWPYLYGVMFVILGGSQANAIIFGQAVLAAASPGSPQDPRLVKTFAIFLVGLICLFQTFSRINYIRFSNLFAIYKVVLFAFIILSGWVILGRTKSENIEQSGPTNLASDVQVGTYTAYGVAISLLQIMRAYAGYEVVNYVLEEIRRPPMDKNRVYRRSLKLNVASITFIYVMVNVAFFAAATTDEILASPDTLALFFTKLFGSNHDTRLASSIILCLSSGGNMMSFVYTNVRIKQEIARMGIIPFPEFWANTTRYNTPGPALLLHFIGTAIFILAAPLGDTNGFLVFSTIPNYARTVISGLLAAPWLKSFKRNTNDDLASLQKWTPQSSRRLKGFVRDITGEHQRQTTCLNLIASENAMSNAVMEALGSAIQTMSGSNANLYVYAALLGSHDRIMGLDLTHGGHLSHGYRRGTKTISMVSKYFETLPYHVNRTTGLIDYDGLQNRTENYRPKIIIAGTSAYSRLIDYGRMRQIASKVGAYLMSDISHISGLIAAKLIPSPFDYSDIVTSSTAKTLRGPRGGIIFYRKQPHVAVGAQNSTPNTTAKIEDALNASVFPGHQSSAHNNTIAALAVALHEARQPEFQDYQRTVLANAQALANELMSLGHKLVSNATENHLLLLDVSPHGIDGARLEHVLELLGVASNRNMLVGDTSAREPSGLRIGSPAMTTRGLRPADFVQIARFLDRAVAITRQFKVEAEEQATARGARRPQSLNIFMSFMQREESQKIIQAFKREIVTWVKSFDLDPEQECGVEKLAAAG
ncbi:glycine hydroxymethyltransferase shm1 [Neopestalotiopsis sp. 37M]|nr:glycine hydroxymethyltransferase shm1 [Neopestalotiopsis sp. 37M]